MKAYLRFFLVLLFTGFTGVLALNFMDIDDLEMDLSLNGVVCNHSSTEIWLTLTEQGRMKPYALDSGRCTNIWSQDAEAIWGKTCETQPCHYQAWKLSAGSFEVYDEESASSGAILRIRGWGVGSQWHITREWPRPTLSAIGYSLVR